MFKVSLQVWPAIVWAPRRSTPSGAGSGVHYNQNELCSVSWTTGVDVLHPLLVSGLQSAPTLRLRSSTVDLTKALVGNLCCAKDKLPSWACKASRRLSLRACDSARYPRSRRWSCYMQADPFWCRVCCDPQPSSKWVMKFVVNDTAGHFLCQHL